MSTDYHCSNNNKCIDNLVKPFVLQNGFHYTLFMAYNDCHCVSYPTNREVGMNVDVTSFY